MIIFILFCFIIIVDWELIIVEWGFVLKFIEIKGVFLILRIFDKLVFLNVLLICVIVIFCFKLIIKLMREIFFVGIFKVILWSLFLILGNIFLSVLVVFVDVGIIFLL